MQKLAEFALNGKSFFFSGPAGTGKSFLLREMVRALREKWGPSKVVVCASTGVGTFHILTKSV